MFTQIAARGARAGECIGRLSTVAARSAVVTMPEATAIVFVVDDDISVRESLELLIKSAGWQPETFASAQDFLSRPPVSHPCCPVLDVTLPGLNGLELPQQLAERTDMPIIFITGYGDIPMSVRAMKAGAVEFLTKPFKDDVLLNAIRGALDRSRAAGRQDSEVRELKNCYEGGRKRAVLRERETQLAQAKENLARISDGVELRVQTAYNKMERTRQMVAVSEELLALRTESRRVVGELLTNGGALGSQAKESAAQEFEAQAALLQSQLDYVPAADEMHVAIGRRPH